MRLRSAPVTEGLVFLGVSTGGSSINLLFPVWAGILGLDAEIVGRDVPVRAKPGPFRSIVAEIARDERLRGALVTTHKVDIYRHAGDLFAGFDRNARLCREVSCIAKRAGALHGFAKDPDTAGAALAAIDWDASGHVLCLGAGGAGTAITVHLLSRREPPARIVVTDADPGTLDTLREIHAELGAAGAVEYRPTEETDALLAALPPGSLVVNATGLGKDLPGSPVRDAASFPDGVVAWELNYRGELDFLRQAREQGVEAHDGWLYFLHGWTQVIAEVFALELDDATFAELAQAAEPFRPR
ncbi:MAG: shikimate dehydrogenase family protein [Gaiellaceae bacterium]